MLRASRLCFIVLLLLLLVPPSFFSMNVSAGLNKYAIPENNGQIQILPRDDGSFPFDGASFNDNIWFFENQRTNGVDCGLSISVKNSNVTITHYNPLLFPYPFEDGFWVGYFRYTVEGVGEQTFKIHHIWDLPIDWNVKIDGVERTQGDGWEYSDGWITVKNASSTVVLLPQLIVNQSEPSLDANGRPYFDSKSLNSSLYFADSITFTKDWKFNASDFHVGRMDRYPSAIFFKTIGDTDSTLARSSWWLILNIFFSSPKIGVMGVADLSVKAHDSKVTITALSSNQTVLLKDGKNIGYDYESWLNYSVSGIGQQSTRISLPSNSSNIAVYIDGVARKEGDGWFFSAFSEDYVKNWVTVTSAKTAVSIHTWDTHLTAQFRGLEFAVDYTPLLLVLASAVAILILLISMLMFRKKRSHKTKIIYDAI